MKYDVSVIIPVYNGKKYLEECMRQLEKQTLKNLEIIFVDDGSTDGSDLILDKYADKYQQVYTAHQLHTGVSAARNLGIELAGGRYVCFMDADDKIDPDIYEYLFQTAYINRLDMVSMDRIGRPFELTVFDEKKDLITSLLRREISMSVCNKIFKKDMLPNPVFPEDKRIHEDYLAVYTVLKRIEKAGCVNAQKYHYIHHDGSSSRSLLFSDKYFDAVDIADMMYKDVIMTFSEDGDRICDQEIKETAEGDKAKTYLRISKIYFRQDAPKEYREKIKSMKRYLKSLPKKNLGVYFKVFDVVRYLTYIYMLPVFLLMVKTIDRK